MFFMGVAPGELLRPQWMDECMGSRTWTQWVIKNKQEVLGSVEQEGVRDRSEGLI